jgi:hypothetical protein
MSPSPLVIALTPVNVRDLVHVHPLPLACPSDPALLLLVETPDGDHLLRSLGPAQVHPQPQ